MKISNLKKSLGDFKLNIDSLVFDPGLIHGIIGANGCGKTTLAKLLSGLIEPDSGDINLDGLGQRDITMVFQRPYLLHDTVYNNLIYPLKLRGKNIGQAKTKYWLDITGLSHKSDQYALSLSSGERQKLSLCRAMIFEPKLIIIDEAIQNLDPDSTKMFEDIFLNRQRKDPATWIIVSHQLAHIKRICNKVHFMKSGSIIESGSVQEILIGPSNNAIKDYLRQESIHFKEENL